MRIEFDEFGTMTEFPVITVVPTGTPAAVAGLQAGDVVVTVSGKDSRERPTGPRPFFAPGDTLTMTVRRQQTDLPIILVFGRTLEDHSDGVATRVCRPLTALSKPAEH